MKVQLVAEIKHYVTMEVDVADTNPETLTKAMNGVMAETGTDLEHDQIIEVELGDCEYQSHTDITEPKLLKD